MINIDKKIIAFDLDGTLAESKQHLQENMSLLLSQLALEKIIVIISGGSFDQFKKQFLPFFKANEEIYKNLILLSTSGSQTYQYLNNDWLMTDIEKFDENIKQTVIKELENISKDLAFGIGAITDGDKVIEDRLTQVTLSALGQKAPIEFKEKWDPDQKKRQQIRQILLNKLSNVNIIIGGTTSIDILPSDFDKAKGLQKLLNKLGLSKEDMLFVGDAIFPGGNDYSVYEAGIETVKVKGPKETAELIKSWIV